MTEAEFKLVLSCLHLDKRPEAECERYGKAFEIFNRLREHLCPDPKLLPGRGWSEEAHWSKRKKK